MASVLQLVSIVAGFAGAVFWFISASGKVHRSWRTSTVRCRAMHSNRALVYSAQTNRIAAALTGLSVLALAAATWVEKARAPAAN